MPHPRSEHLCVTAASIFPGTTVRYHYRTGSDLATVVERTDRYVTFVGERCDGRFTDEQIDRLIADDRLQIVLDDELHAPEDGLPEPLRSDPSDPVR